MAPKVRTPAGGDGESKTAEYPTRYDGSGLPRAQPGALLGAASSRTPDSQIKPYPRPGLCPIRFAAGIIRFPTDAPVAPKLTHAAESSQSLISGDTESSSYISRADLGKAKASFITMLESPCLQWAVGNNLAFDAPQGASAE